MSMTFAACETETVGPPVVVVAEELSEALAFVSLPGVADPLDGVAAGEVLDDGMSAIAELGATRAAEGGTEPTDAVCDALMDAEADGADGD
jgi:hypothetical protein